MNLRGRLSDESGFTLVELLVVMVILGIVLGALTQLFVSGIRTEADQLKRFSAQQEGRLALDSLRREIHCADTVTPTSEADYPRASISISLGAFCPTFDAAAPTVLWCTTPSGSHHSLIRTTEATCTGGVQKADYLTRGDVFTNVTSASSGTGQRATLSVRLPVDVDLAAAGGVYELRDNIVLRNTSR